MAIFKEFSPSDHDRSAEDRRRHRQLVEKSIKENIGDILSEESIVGEGKNKKVKIPVRGIKEYQFIYGSNSPAVGSGNGSEKKGDRLGREKDKNQQKGKNGAGNEEGEDIYETEITLEDVLEYIMEDMELPSLDKRKFSDQLMGKTIKKSGYQKNGIRPRLSKKRTVMEKIKREKGTKRALRELGRMDAIERFPFKLDDLRYYKIKEKPKKELNAAIICVMDTSGSMDITKKYLARSFFFVLSRFIRMKYNNVEVAFIAHTTTAKEVSENEFFHKAESGGTYISSGLEKAKEVITERYNPAFWNVYTFYVSDGDNWIEDNEKAVQSAKDLCKLCNMLGYAEIMPTYYVVGIKDKLIKEVPDNNFVAVTMKQKSDMWDALKAMLKKEAREG